MISKNNIDFISIENQNQDFPQHFHETFCVSLIRKGIEKIDFGSSFLYSGQNVISITNPFEVHSNPIVDNDLSVSFDTIYLSPDIMKYFLNGNMVEFKNRQIHDKQTILSFIKLVEILKSKDDIDIEKHLKKLTHLLYPFSQNSDNMNHHSFDSEYLRELIVYIEEHIEDKLYLDELAQITNLNKFGFSKKFKSITGMSPMNYVLMKKVFSAKKIMEANTDTNLTDLAFDYNFTDLAHFSHAFKRFIGISPRTYLER